MNLEGGQGSNIGEFQEAAELLISKFNQFAEKHALKECAEVDHICYKCGGKEEFEAERAMLEKESNFVFQSMISDRRIAVIRLKEGLDTALGAVRFVELSDQKPDGSQLSGFDHIEIVPKGISYDELVKKIKDGGEEVTEVKRPHHTTHDLNIGGWFGVKISHGSLIEKIRSEEMK